MLTWPGFNLEFIVAVRIRVQSLLKGGQLQTSIHPGNLGRRLGGGIP